MWLLMQRRLITSMEKIKQPQWARPQLHKARTPLKLYNSLTRQKDQFVSIQPKRVLWYSCGPTVYDSAHMGHARNYVSIDINRRLIQDYFGYEVVFVQNVTDIDDKIIVRARQKYLYNVFSDKVRKGQITNAYEIGRDALEQFSTSAFGDYSSHVPLKTLDEFLAWRSTMEPNLSAKDPKFRMHADAIQSALKGLSSPMDEFLHSCEGVLAKYLDKEEGHSVVNHEVFRELASFYENDFNNDMQRLNVRSPTVTTRVSEYIFEIIEYVKKIVDRGYGYSTTDGSVYFDTAAFEAAPNHDYAKLQPWNKGVQELIDEGEGTLSLKGTGKKSKSDFALWKASKSGEPSWSSPWGSGRPGWHIECSVMASHVLGDRIDIHSGGIDLAFPHHDNELAQAEAFYESAQWINYFLHTGHLHIEGQKMSKSLKNFITIKEALKLFSERQLRLAFALQQWNTPLDFKMSLSHVKSVETILSNYFNTIAALNRDRTASSSKHVTDVELQLLADLYETQLNVDAAFADNLSVPVAIQHITGLVQKANLYLAKCAASPRIEIPTEIARWITHIMNILGFRTSSDFGWASDGEGNLSSNEANLEFVQLLSQFRDEVRFSAREKKDQHLLSLCDKLREELFAKGCALDDRKDQPALIKFMTADEVTAALEERKKAAEQENKQAEEKARHKAAAHQLEAQKKEELRQKAQIRPQDMFKYGDYTEFDANGIPTHDANHAPLSKNLLKKLQKQWKLQDNLYKKYHQ